MDALRLAAIRFFADLPQDELAAVASMASEEEIPPGQSLAAEGRVGYSLYAIESGTADVVIDGKTVGTIGAGDVVGEMAVLISPPDWSAPPDDLAPAADLVPVPETAGWPHITPEGDQ